LKYQNFVFKDPYPNNGSENLNKRFQNTNLNMHLASCNKSMTVRSL
jgi:hypothetical protein